MLVRFVPFDAPVPSIFPNQYFLAVGTPNYVTGEKDWEIINPKGNTLAYCLEHKALLEKYIASTCSTRLYDDYNIAYRTGWHQLNKALQMYHGIKTTTRRKSKSKKRKKR